MYPVHKCTQCSGSPHANSHSSLRLSSDGPQHGRLYVIPWDQCVLTKCLKPACSLPQHTLGQLTHANGQRKETQVTSLSQPAHYLLNICWIFLVLFCFRMGWEWMLCHNPNTVKFCIFHILCKNRHLNQ